MQEKRGVYVLVGLLVILGGVVIINALAAGTTHYPGEISVSVKGYTMNLQQAVNNNYLKEGGSSPTASLTSSTYKKHNGNTIYVWFDGSSKTLQEAINTGDLCSSSVSGSPTVPEFGHSADEVSITLNDGSGTEVSLQQAINNRFFCCTDTTWNPATSTVCSDQNFPQTSNCGNTRTATGTKTCTPTDCTTSATFGTGVTQFTVQPVGTSGTTKTGTCTDPAATCDGLPKANCNNGVWTLNTNTCRAKNLVWIPYVVPGPVDCSGVSLCSGGGSCTTEGAGCATACISGIGAAGVICTDPSCTLVFTGSTIVPSCPTCVGGGITCSAQSYNTGCGSATLPGGYAASSALTMTCPGSCAGTITATCSATGTWTGISNTCHTPSNCIAGTDSSGDYRCTYPATTHGQININGICSNYGTCSVGCFDGTVGVKNNCLSCEAYCAASCGETCAGCEFAGPDACNTCMNSCVIPCVTNNC